MAVEEVVVEEEVKVEVEGGSRVMEGEVGAVVLTGSKAPPLQPGA